MRDRTVAATRDYNFENSFFFFFGQWADVG